MKRQFLMTCVTLMGLCAFAEDYSGYQVQQTRDSNAASSSFTRANWGEDSHAAQVGEKYLVPEGSLMVTPSSNGSFVGDVLAIAGELEGMAQTKTYTFKQLRLLPGGKVWNRASQGTITYTTTGGTVVEGTSENPAILAYFTGHGAVTYGGSFSGEKGAVVKLTSSTPEATRDAVLDAVAVLPGSWEGYKGVLVVGKNRYAKLNYRKADYASTGVLASYPGGITVAEGGILSTAYTTAHTCKVGDLTLEPGSELLVPVSGSGTFATYTVTNVFSASGAFRIAFSTTADYQFPIEPLSVPVLHLVGPAAETVADLSEAVIDNFVLPDAGPMTANLRLELVDNNDGTKDVAVVHGPAKGDYIVMRKNNNTGGVSDPRAFVAGNGDCWSSAEVPSTDYNGIAYVRSDCALTTERYVTTCYEDMKLIVPDGNTLYHQGYGLTVGELYLCAGATIRTYSGAPWTVIGGKIIICPQTGKAAVITGDGNGKSVTVLYQLQADISGVGDLTLTARDDVTPITYELSGDNGDFHGALAFKSTAARYGAGVDNAVVYKVNGGDCLGGGYAGAASWQALQFSNFAKVYVNENNFVTNATRGLYVEGGARIEVAAETTLSVAGSTTYSAGGKIVKTGSGRLALGKALFTENGTEPTGEPSASGAFLDVNAGSVVANDKDAFNGVTVTFAEGTTFGVDLKATDEGLLNFGAVNTNALFASTAYDGKIHLDVAGEVLTEKEVSVGICTVSSTAPALSFDYPSRISRRHVSVAQRANPDGTITYVLTVVGKQGIVLIVR